MSKDSKPEGREKAKSTGLWVALLSRIRPRDADFFLPVSPDAVPPPSHVLVENPDEIPEKEAQAVHAPFPIC